MSTRPLSSTLQVAADASSRDNHENGGVSRVFQISCCDCSFCNKRLYTQCETIQVRDQGMGAALFGYSELYGEIPGGQAELLRVPQAQFIHIKVPVVPPDTVRLSARRVAYRLAGRRVR